MKTVILADSRQNFQRDISTALMLETYPIDLIPAKNFEELVVLADQHPGATLVVSDSLESQYDPSRMSKYTVYGYVSNPNMVSRLQELNIACIGLHKTSRSLLNAISGDTLPIMQPVGISSPRPVQHQTQQAPSQSSRPQQKERPQQAPQQQQSMQTAQQPAQAAPQQTPNGMTMTPEMMAMFQMMMRQMSGGQFQTQPQQPIQQPAQQPVQQQTPQPAPVQQESVQQAPQPVQTAPTGGETIRATASSNSEREMDRAIDEDLLINTVADNRKTKVVTVYAAKGGVGKTSIATELATCLALTSNGRRKFRVCIVDYNIDFGDVATTLLLDEHGANMTYWASEIRELLACGKTTDEITFDQKQMETYYLQKVETTGLYALAAPIMHEDSMFIKSEELDIMLDNLIQNGGFDYIICDTGNNTRDSTVIAIDKADYVLLVATQDVTTANCNASVLRTLRDTGFDTDKVRLVLNNIMPSRDTGISVQEVEETFPYQCVCRIKNTSDIIRANNLGQPLVYKPNHEYTKQIQRIVRFVTQGELTQEEPNQGLFGRIFKKKAR